MADPNPLHWLGVELNRCLERPGANVVVFGGAVLLLHGIRDEIGDVDLFITEEAWAHLRVRHGDQWKLQFPTPGDPPLLEWLGGERRVHAFVRWTRRDWWIHVEEAWRRRELVQSWPCAPLDLVRRWKVDSAKWRPGDPGHAKHLADVGLIDAHLAQKAA